MFIGRRCYLSPCHSSFLPHTAYLPTPLLAGEIPPFALPPFWKLWLGKCPLDALKQSPVKDAEKCGPFTTSQDLLVDLHSQVGTK